MAITVDSSENMIRSFSCRCIVREGEVYAVGPIKQMCRFFGTTEDAYKDGILSRIRKDISKTSADQLRELCLTKGKTGEDFRIVYPSVRADGTPCTIQLDAYAGDESENGRYYDIIGMDITLLVESKNKADSLAVENLALTEDSPVGLGIYHIKGSSFDLVYTNPEYYSVHYGSKEYWDSFRGKSALCRILADDYHVVTDEWKRTLQDPERHLFDARYRCYGEDGLIHWVHLLGHTAGFTKDGEHICYAAYVNIDREKQAESAAEELRKKLIDTINKLPTVSVLYVVEGDCSLKAQSISDGFCRMTGFFQSDAWEFYAPDAFATVHPDEKEELRSFLIAHRGDRQANSFTCRIMTASGKYKWVSINFFFFNVEDICYLYVTYNDIDEVKKQEELLEKQYMSAQSFLDSISGTFLATIRTNVTQNMVEHIGGTDPLLSKQEFHPYNESLEAIISTMPRERDRAECRRLFSREGLLEAYDSGQNTVVQDYCFQSESGRHLWVRAKTNLLRRPGSEDIIAFSTVEDINRTKVIETIMNDILVKQYDCISCIDTSSRTVIPVIGSQFLPMKHNNDYDSLVRGYSERFLPKEGQKAYLDFMALDHVCNMLEEGGKCSASFTVREDGILKNKRLEFFDIDRESGLVALIRTDFTELQKAQLEQQEKLRTALDSAKQASLAKSTFLSRMSHEIRTPMNAIIGMDTLAAQAIGDDEKVSNCIGKIGISARYLLSLINDILDMSRIESGKMLLKNERFLFRDFIAGINAMIYNQASSKGLDYECIVSNEIDEAYFGDAMKLQQVLINVLGNAVKFTEKGKISFEIQQLSRTGNSSKLRFSVGDTGCGISDEHIANIFEPFEQADTSNTTPFGGTGLGLAITKNLLSLMGGTIRVRSIIGVGSEFTIDLPLTVDETVLVAPKVTYHLDKMHALIVDDDIIICEQAGTILKEIGMIGEWVTSGREAVERVQHNFKKTSYYDFILIDWKMPDMDGIETTRQIRKIVGPDVSIIIISAYDWETIEVEAKAAGANMLISKPLFKSTLVSAFQKAKGQAESEPDKEFEFDFTGKRLLLAEDNQINAEIAHMLLESKHFIVDHAPNGLKALEMFTQSPVGYYDAILMDVRMPMMDGLQATNNIRHWNKPDAKTIPIIAMTANAFDEDVEKSRAAGMNAHLSKPIEPELLYRTLYRIIGEYKKPSDCHKDPNQKSEE